MKVLKFGGSSIATPERIRAVVLLVEAARREESLVLVVSALAGVTDALIGAAALAAAADDGWEATHRELGDRHLVAARALAAAEERSALEREIEESFLDLQNLLRGASLVRECSPRTLDSIASYGERLSATIVAAAFRQSGADAEACDARALVLTDDSFGAAQVDLEVTRERIRAHMQDRSALQIVTGFIGATAAGETTTLGRGGSDYTASLVGAALHASAIEIWTDVDGVMSADPRLAARAFSIPSLTYDELMELSHFGAKVVYPPTVHPARKQSIPLVIRNTLNPAFPGTRVGHTRPESAFDICGISSISRVALLRLEGDGMVGVPGIAMRLFGALAHEGISVILISQASSEHSICVAIQPDAVARARERIAGEFAVERHAGLIDELVVDDDVSLIAAVGDGIRQRPGAVGRLFAVLGSHGIPVETFTAGSSERNISIATSRRYEVQALNAIHDALFFPTRRTIAVYLAGIGRVGTAFLDQLRCQAAVLERQEHIEVRLAGIASSRRMLIDPLGIDPSSWRDRFETDGRSAGLTRFMDLLLEHRRPVSVFIDCTASDEPSGWFSRLLDAGIPIVASNKRPFSGPLEVYRQLRDTARQRRGASLYYETTVGAGLPVLGTLSDLVRTGDRIERVEGVLSGTISFVLDRLRAGERFSDAVREAHACGYTEPDPRDDLTGADVARKILILAREAGYDLEPGAVSTASLLPPDWTALDPDQFWMRLPSLDAKYAARQAEADSTGRRLCYLARAAKGVVTVGLEAVSADHPCAGLTGTDNLIAFSSARYHLTPLVVRGPGAGPHVTAAGVFADVLRAATEAR